MARPTTAIETGYKAIPGANHKSPAYHYKMAPGFAWKRGPDGYDVVPVDGALCKKAEQAFMLIWVSGVTATQFNVGGEEFFQPIVDMPTPKGKKYPRDEMRITDTVGAGTSPATFPRTEVVESKPARAVPKKASAPKVEPRSPAPKKRKGGYGLD